MVIPKVVAGIIKKRRDDMKKQTRIISLILTLVLCLSFSVFATRRQTRLLC